MNQASTTAEQVYFMEDKDAWSVPFTLSFMLTRLGGGTPLERIDVGFSK